MAIADKTYFLNADKTKTVAEDSPDAAYLLAREGGQVSDEDVKKYGVKTRTEKAAPAEEPNIVITGGVDSKPGIVRGETLEAETEEPAPKAKTAKK